MPATCAHGACPKIVNHYCDIIPKNCAWVLLPRVHQFTDINDKTRRNDSMTFSSGEKLTLMIMCGAALALAACGQAGADRTTVKQDTRHAKSLTMMSFNIRAGRGLEGDGNIPEGELGHLPQCAEVIKAADPDWVAIQEIDCGTKRTGRIDQTAALAKLCDLNSTYFKKIDHDGGTYGVAVLSKEKPISVSKILVPGSAHTRCIAILEFADYIVACTHFPLDESARIKAAEIACLNLAGRERPVFFAGDFNALPESSTLATLKKTFTILSDPSKPTFRSDRPSQCIDYIMVDSVHADDVTVVSRDVIAAPQATDHCALVVRAEVARPQRSTNHIHQP